MNDNIICFAIVAVLCILVLILIRVVIDFERKFNMYIFNTINRSTLTQSHLTNLQDTLLLLASVFRPVYSSVFNRYVVNDEGRLQKDILKCIDNSVCVGDECCCVCLHHAPLRSKENDAVYDAGYSCTVLSYNDNMTYVVNCHGHCNKFEHK